MGMSRSMSMRMRMMMRMMMRMRRGEDMDEDEARGFNGSVNISESCDFLSQFDPLDIIF